ncbi:MAG: twin transmembrane helix small protein [Rhodobiaceae bacterium]|jgi:type II secretory pathway component PulJ|nr:twin transmembrane helix small protein [Rhodobiaceae bacterium]MBT5641026.1 twin transmembrane helix small protein [Rhodobiaceae bacterium]MBT6222909.1 twin transmembrane helix small protein [Rhodobiaceae bacterium]MDC3272469.1 twin transmembrane helix small protein [Hyphomicrobiales bacterium]
MDTLLNILLPLSIGSVFLVLVLGIFNMIRKGSSHKSQNLMRLRVITQFIAIIVVVIYFYYKK